MQTTTPVASEADIQDLYRATTSPRLVDVPRLRFMCSDGHGDPNTSPAYATAIQTLYAVAYTAKFALKKAGGPSFKVPPLEGLWWSPDPKVFVTGDAAAWNWSMMIRLPDCLDDDLFDDAAAQVTAKKSFPATETLRLTSFEEGPSAQILHIGPYATEGPTIARLHDFIRAQGFSFEGKDYKHHEIYLGDPRRSAPERLRTIIRQPYDDRSRIPTT